MRVLTAPGRFGAASLSLALLIAPGLPATAAPRPPAAAPRPPAAAEAPLAARAAAVQQRLTSGTRELEAAQRPLAAALVRRQQALAAQARIRSELVRATAGLNAFAATAYRESAGDGWGLLLQLGEQDPSDALAAAGYLAQAGSHRAEVIGRFRAAEARAEAAGLLAARAQQRAAQIQQRVVQQVATLQSAAAAAGAALTGPGRASRAVSRRPLPATDLASLAAASYPNGLIPPSALCGAGIAAEVLRCDAAAGFRRLVVAYAAAFGQPICVTDSYRSYPEQVAVYRQRPSLAAVPGTSNHGWGLAVDLCGGLQNAGSMQDRWMHASAGRFGWAHPDWAEPGGSRPEPWHWEFVGLPSAP